MVRLKRNMGENFLLEVKKTKFKILKIGEDNERKLGDMVQKENLFHFLVNLFAHSKFRGTHGNFWRGNTQKF